jgi:predicted SprT family Zn-dependent metalloprotease
MARVVDCWPSSDDEPSDVHTIQRPAMAKEVLKPAFVSSSPQKDLVPKSTSKPRRIRRLDGAALGPSNVLLQRFDLSQEAGSPRKSPFKRDLSRKDGSTLQPSIFDEEEEEDMMPFSPTKKGASSRDISLIQPSIFDEDEAPPTTARAPRFRRLRALPSLKSDFEDEDSQSSLMSLKQMPILGRLQLNSSAQINVPAVSEQEQSVLMEKSQLVVKSQPVEEDQDLIDAQLVEEFQALGLTSEFKLTEEDPKLGQSSDTVLPVTLPSHTNNDGDVAGAENLRCLTPQSPTTEATPQPPHHTGDDDAGFKTKKTVLSPKKSDSLNRQMPQHDGASKLRLTTSLFRPSTRPRGTGVGKNTTSSIDLSNELSKLRLDLCESSDQENEAVPQTPIRMRKTKRMVSLTKPAGLPKTPHKPTEDAFWDQELVNEWNDQVSPRRAAFMPVPGTSTSGSSPKKGEKKTFDAKKHQIASDFFLELDTQITEGKIGQLAESTGGVNLIWSKTLNTTAGRANWKRETTRTKDEDGNDIDVQHQHHASIELAEKVINDENRLLNVVAHEFCHLANFMINGVTNNPHGKEFKIWAAKCSRIFGSRGIKVTTKHTYDIDYKYVWACVACGAEFRRHSKSIDPSRHRCGTCKDILKQIKPVPRGGAKPSEYQVFVKEQMAVVRRENPGSPQKDIMRIIAEKWAKKPKTSEVATGEQGDDNTAEEQLASQTIDLTLEATE